MKNRFIYSFNFLLIIGAFLFTSCESAISNSGDEEFEYDQPTLRERTNFEEYYALIINDPEFKSIAADLKSSLVGFNATPISNQEAFFAQAIALQKNNSVSKYVAYWKRDKFLVNDPLLISQLILKTTDKVFDFKPTDLNDPEGCHYDSGIFVFQTEYLDCENIEGVFGCCAGLLCETNNCLTDALNEYLDQAGLDFFEVSSSIAFSLAWNRILNGYQAAYSSIAGFIVFQTLVQAAHYADLVWDITSCSWDMIFNYYEWASPCNCPCPIIPECDVETDHPMGGYLFPVGCE